MKEIRCKMDDKAGELIKVYTEGTRLHDGKIEHGFNTKIWRNGERVYSGFYRYDLEAERLYEVLRQWGRQGVKMGELASWQIELRG
jgi:hypothetical protein